MPWLIGRFSVAGALNSLVGYAVIFACMWYGLGPVLSNVMGYAVGLLLAYQLNLRFVFRPQGGKHARIGRFLAAFALSFLANLLILQLGLRLGLHAVLAQIVAAAPYLAIMFLLGRHWVYREVTP